MNYVVGVDIGGTFTDCVVVDEGGKVTIGKSLSTPADFAQGALNAADDAAQNVGLKNADELLSEDWIPAIPGINVPGDYMKDYGSDPESWVKKEHRKAYGDMLDFKVYP